MEGVKDFLMEEQAVPGDDEGLQRQLDQCLAFVKEIDTVESSLKNMKEVETHLQSCPVSGIKTWVQTKLVDNQTQLEKYSKEGSSKKDKLSEDQETVFNLKKDLKEMQEWMMNMTLYLDKDCEYNSPEELENHVQEMMRAKEDVLQKEVQIKILKDNIQDIDKKVPSSGQELTSALNVELENYQLLCNRIQGRWNNLEEILLSWQRLLTYLDLETSWLNTLEDKLRSLETPPEKEDALLEAKESLESVLQHPADNRTQIQELGQTLIDGGVMNNLVSEKLEAFNSRYEELSSLAESKEESLGKQLCELRKTGEMLEVLLDSLQDLDKQLTTYLTDGVDASQVPQEAKRIELEISSHKTALEALRQSTSSLPPNFPEDRANQNRNNFDVMQRKLQELSTKFQKFQHPAKFEQRMLDCERVLDSIKESIQLLDMKDVDPDVIKKQVDKCMGLWTTLSEVKLEVETVIKTGRQIVQNQQTDNPKGLEEQLTSLKMFWDDLNAQLLMGQDPLPSQSVVSTEVALEGDVPSSDLEKLENDIDYMLKVVEKHLESNEEDEKMDEERTQIEDILRRGEQMLHQPMEEDKKEEIRVQLLLLDTRYKAIPIQQRRTGQAASLLSEEYLVEMNTILRSVDDAELSLNTPELNSTLYTDLSVQENVLKDIKVQLDKLGEQIAVIHKKQRDIIVQASGPEVIQIQDTLSELDLNWHKVNRMYNDRKGYVDRSMDEWIKFHCDLNELTYLTTEAEELLADALAPDGGLDLEKTRELEETLSRHQPSFAALNRSWDSVVQRLCPLTGSALKDKLDRLNQRCAAVIAEVKDRQPRIYRANEQAMEYRRRLDEITCWLTKAENAVQKRSTTELEENFRELANLNEEIKVQVDNLKWLNRTELEMLSDKSLSLHEREKMSESLRTVNSTWNKVCRDVPTALKKRGQEPCSVSQTRTAAHPAPLKVVLASSASEPPHTSEISVLDDLDKTTTELADWLILIDQMLKSNIVTVGDVGEINETISRMKITKADMEQRHPQLHHGFTLAQNLKNKASSSDVRTAITEKLEEVRNHWDNTQQGVEMRHKQLEDMVIDSQKWHNYKEETEELMRKYEARLYILPQARRDPLIKQISDNQMLLQELGAGDGIVMAFENILQKLLRDYCKDDTRNVKETTERLKTSWINLKQRVHLEASVERGNKLLMSLEELNKWLNMKAEELKQQMPIGGDVPALQLQYDHCKALRRELKEKEYSVLIAIHEARVFLADQPIEAPEELRGNLQSKTELTPEEITEDMLKQSSELKNHWERLNTSTINWQKQVDKALEKLRDLQGAMDDLDADMKEAEAVRNGWRPVGDLLIDLLQDHIGKTMAFREEIAPINPKVKTVNDFWNQLSPLDLRPSLKMSCQIDDLNMRWKLLQVSVDDHLKQLQEAHRDFEPSQHCLTSSVQLPWQRFTADNEVPYYIKEDKHTQIQQYCQTLGGESTVSQPQSPAHIINTLEREERAELERAIAELEEEERNLQMIYEQLKEQYQRKELPVSSPRTHNSEDSVLIAEVKLLRQQHKGRLEARMKILEDHNMQLDSQLSRLRQLLEQKISPMGVDNRQIETLI